MEYSQPLASHNWTFRRVVWATLVLVFVALSFYLFIQFNQVVLILLIAIVMGTVIRPAVNWLHRRGLPRLTGVVLVFLLMFTFIIGFFLLLFPLIFEQGTAIAAAVPGYYQSLRDWVAHYPDLWMVRLSHFLPEVLPSLGPTQPTGQQMIASAGQVLSFVGSAAQIIFMTTAFLLLAFHWTLDGPRTIQSLLLLIPKEHREGTRELITSMEIKVSAYVAGQGVLCLTIGLMALVVYLILGLPNVLLLALLACVMEAVPLVGPLIGAVPAALVALSIAPDKLGWVIIATLVIHQLENYVLAPRIMNKAVGVNPFVALLAFIGFGSLLGIGGVLMAMPMAAIIQLILDRYIFQSRTMDSEIATGRDYASRLRYETQALAQDLRKQARFKKGGSDQRIKQIDHVMDEIEGITTDLDALLAQVPPSGAA
jgi:predicted PurR-regulated permease PerM